MSIRLGHPVAYVLQYIMADLGPNNATIKTVPYYYTWNQTFWNFRFTYWAVSLATTKNKIQYQ